MDYDYKSELLLQAIFPTNMPLYIVKEKFIGQQSLRKIIEEFFLLSI